MFRKSQSAFSTCFCLQSYTCWNVAKFPCPMRKFPCLLQSKQAKLLQPWIKRLSGEVVHQDEAEWGVREEIPSRLTGWEGFLLVDLVKMSPLSSAVCHMVAVCLTRQSFYQPIIAKRLRIFVIPPSLHHFIKLCCLLTCWIMFVDQRCWVTDCTKFGPYL